MILKRYYVFIFLSSVFCLLSSVFAYADTAYLKDGKEIKGLVVEDYKDRIVLSTVNGEVELQKSDIKELYYDNEEEGLINLAEQAKERRDYARAFTYYNMALKANPGSKGANDGLVFLQGYLFRKEESEKLDDIKRRENIERYGTVVSMDKILTDEEKLKDLTKRLWSGVGLVIVMENDLPKIVDVRLKSPAYMAGMRKNDFIVGLWTKLIRHMAMIEVMDALLDKPSLEVKCTIERSVEIDPSGLSFNMEPKGLTISEVRQNGNAVVGEEIKKDDLVFSIDGKSTRYMPLNKAMKLIKKGKDSVNLTIRREVLIWRGE